MIEVNPDKFEALSELHSRLLSGSREYFLNNTIERDDLSHSYGAVETYSVCTSDISFEAFTECMDTYIEDYRVCLCTYRGNHFELQFYETAVNINEVLALIELYESESVLKFFVGDEDIIRLDSNAFLLAAGAL